MFSEFLKSSSEAPIERSWQRSQRKPKRFSPASVLPSLHLDAMGKVGMGGTRADTTGADSQAEPCIAGERGNGLGSARALSLSWVGFSDLGITLAYINPI